MNWLSLFVDMYNREIMEKIVKWTEPGDLILLIDYKNLIRE